MSGKVLVSDTNIWIDLYHGGLLEHAFRLPYQFVTTEFAWNELLSPPGVHLQKLGLSIESLESTEVSGLYELMTRLGNSSLADVSCYYLATTRQWVLLTGDRAVRNDGLAAKLEVHGVLWLMDEMLEHSLVGGADLAVALQAMLGKGARLPSKECGLRIKRWTPDS